jgi:hypothetical protein
MSQIMLALTLLGMVLARCGGGPAPASLNVTAKPGSSAAAGGAYMPQSPLSPPVPLKVIDSAVTRHIPFYSQPIADASVCLMGQANEWP